MVFAFSSGKVVVLLGMQKVCHASSGPQRRVVIYFYLRRDILGFLKTNQPKQKTTHTYKKKIYIQSLRKRKSQAKKQPTKQITNPNENKALACVQNFSSRA